MARRFDSCTKFSPFESFFVVNLLKSIARSRLPVARQPNNFLLDETATFFQIDNDIRTKHRTNVNPWQFLFISSRGSSVSSDDFSSLASPDSVNNKTKPTRGKLKQRAKNIKPTKMEGTSGSSGSGRGKTQTLLKRRYSVPEIIMRKWVEKLFTRLTFHLTFVTS